MIGKPCLPSPAVFIPGAGMVGCWLRHRGDELLGQRGGVDAYVSQRMAMGIPLLHPWASRLSRRRFRFAGREVVIDPDATPLCLDDSGLPMHGLLSAAHGRRVARTRPPRMAGWLAAAIDFAAHDALIAAFPLPHRIGFEARLAGPALTIATTITATGVRLPSLPAAARSRAARGADRDPGADGSSLRSTPATRSRRCTRRPTTL